MHWASPLRSLTTVPARQMESPRASSVLRDICFYKTAAVKVIAMLTASAARTRAAAPPIIASARQPAKALHPDLAEIPHREQHAIDCRDNSQDFAPVVHQVQPMGEGCLFQSMRLVMEDVKHVIFPGRDEFAVDRQASNSASQSKPSCYKGRQTDVHWWPPN